MGVSNKSFVLFVYHSVAVGILKDQVAGFWGTLFGHAAIGQERVNFRLILEYAQGLVTPEITHRIANLHAECFRCVFCNDGARTVDDPFFVGQTEHFVLIMGKIQVDVVLEFFSNLIVPRKGQFNALILNVPSVDIWGTRTVGSQSGSDYQPVFGGFDIPVEIQTQTGVKETCIKPQVKLFRCFPGNVCIGQDVGIGSGGGSVLIFVIVSICVESNSSQLLEVVNVAVPVLTPASAQFKKVHDVCDGFHKRFVGDNPPGRYRGEISPAFTPGEVG